MRIANFLAAGAQYNIVFSFIDALGGHLNIVEIEPAPCIRVQVKTQPRAVDEAAHAWTLFWLSFR